MTIPENILQQVADEAFQSSNGGMMGLLTCNTKKNHVFWHEERYERRAVIQHALNNPALAPFLAAKPTPPAETAAQVPLGPEDVPPGSVFSSNTEEGYIVPLLVGPTGMIIATPLATKKMKFTELMDSGWQINISIPDTGRWDANAWRPCSKPAGKEVAK